MIQRELKAGRLRTSIASSRFDMSFKYCLMLRPFGLQIVGSLAQLALQRHPPQRTIWSAGIGARLI